MLGILIAKPNQNHATVHTPSIADTIQAGNDYSSGGHRYSKLNHADICNRTRHRRGNGVI